MRVYWRVLAASALAVVLIVALTAIDGCGTADCNDTATCPTPRDASLSDVGAGLGDEATDALADGGDGALNMDDAADDDNDSLIMLGDAPVDAIDATEDADMSDSPAETGPPDTALDVGVDVGLDVGADVGVDVGPPPPMCRSNPLVPKTAVASSAHAGDVATNAIDGNFTTRWDSAHGVDPQWIYLDFGARVFVNRVRISWETACGANYDIQTSNDLTTWTTIQSIMNNSSSNGGPTNWNGAVDHTGLSGFGRYLRINGTVRCGANVATYGYSIWEMQVFGDTSLPCRP